MSVSCIFIFVFVDADSLTKRSNQRTLHVAIVGNTGVGKSTLVNVLKGDKIAEVNNDVKPCTTRKKEYEVVDGNTTYHIWDTRGLNEASGEGVLPIRFLKFARVLPDADRELKRFLRGKEPSVDLVLLCIDAKKTKVEVHWKIFDKVYVDFCEEGLKVAVVVTRLKEKDFSGPGSEWKSTCKGTAKKVVKAQFPDTSLIEAVPEFGELSDKSVIECRGRILTLISKACSK